MMSVADPTQHGFTAVSPSNIAFLKYWGKRDATNQWPANDSISMTLSACKTTTTARRSANNFDSFTLDGVTINSNVHNEHKIFRHLNRVRSAFNMNGNLDVVSQNSFPSSCGIASSASGFSALTIACVAALYQTTRWDEFASVGASRDKLAHLSRLGSGSAGRSMFGGYVKWTAGPSSDEQTIKQLWTETHWDLADVIIILSPDAKEVASSEAHAAAWGSRLFGPRLAGIEMRARMLEEAIKTKDIELLGREIESEALEMHAICMTGSPQITYITETTSSFLSWLRSERGRGRIQAWATIDAGPNVHLICKKEHAQKTAEHVKANWNDAQIILDSTGPGPHMTTSQGDAHRV